MLYQVDLEREKYPACFSSHARTYTICLSLVKPPEKLVVKQTWKCNSYDAEQSWRRIGRGSEGKQGSDWHK